MDVESDDDEEDDLEEEEEDTEAELGMTSLSVYPKTKTSVAHLSKDWSSPVYVFFRQTPRIEYKKERQCHVFECAAANCKARTGRDVHQFLDTSDAKSTRNMRKHVKVCWGAETVTAADATKCLAGAREVLAKAKLKDGLITAKFVRIGKGKVTYSHRQHKNGSKVRRIPSIDTFLNKSYRAEIVLWVSESKRPFKVVKDRGFQKLMKTGQPEYHIPSPETISRDVKKVFLHVQKCMAKMLQVY
jgi:hypothetical protein